MTEQEASPAWQSVAASAVVKDDVLDRTINGKAGPWQVLGRMQTSKGSWAVSVVNEAYGHESFVVGQRATLRVKR